MIIKYSFLIRAQSRFDQSGTRVVCACVRQSVLWSHSTLLWTVYACGGGLCLWRLSDCVDCFSPIALMLSARMSAVGLNNPLWKLSACKDYLYLFWLFVLMETADNIQRYINFHYVMITLCHTHIRTLKMEGIYLSNWCLEREGCKDSNSAM